MEAVLDALLAEFYDVVLGADLFYVFEFGFSVWDVQTQIIDRSVGANESFLELTRAQLAAIAEDFEQTEYDCDGVAILRSLQRRGQGLLHELVVEEWHVQIVQASSSLRNVVRDDVLLER